MTDADVAIIFKSPNGKTLGTAEQDVDGYYYFHPGEHIMGHWDAGILLHIANELNRLNAEWDAQVERELERG